MIDIFTLLICSSPPFATMKTLWENGVSKSWDPEKDSGANLFINRGQSEMRSFSQLQLSIHKDLTNRVTVCICNSVTVQFLEGKFTHVSFCHSTLSKLVNFWLSWFNFHCE